MTKQIPIQVQQMIDDLNDPSTPIHVKQNRLASLENIRERITIAVANFNKKKR